MLWAPRRVVDVKHPVGAFQFESALHRAMLAGLVAGHFVVVRDAVALVADEGPAHGAELALVGRVGGQDGVARVQHDHRLRLVFQIRQQRVHLRRRVLRWLRGCGVGRGVEGFSAGHRTILRVGAIHCQKSLPNIAVRLPFPTAKLAVQPSAPQPESTKQEISNWNQPLAVVTLPERWLACILIPLQARPLQDCGFRPINKPETENEDQRRHPGPRAAHCRREGHAAAYFLASALRRANTYASLGR